jgi:hypothetical protein
MNPIVCIESNWDGKNASTASIWPILQLLSIEEGIESVHLTCNTREELAHNLKMNYGFRNGILYFAMHGRPGRINLGNGDMVLIEDLASLMNSRFAGWYVHFGSCGTLRTAAHRKYDFKERTGAVAVSGYLKDVDWIESTALDLLMFYASQRYEYPGNLKKFMRSSYPDLIKRCGWIIINTRKA